jgi:hypothetical protein
VIRCRAFMSASSITRSGDRQLSDRMPEAIDEDQELNQSTHVVSPRPGRANYCARADEGH